MTLSAIILTAIVAALSLLLAVVTALRTAGVTPRQRAGLAALRAGLLGLCAVMIADPARLYAVGQPDRSTVAVVVDTSRSMLLPGPTARRCDEAGTALGEMLPILRRSGVVSGHRFSLGGVTGGGLEALAPAQDGPDGTDIGGALAEVLEQSGAAPPEAILLVSDGADTTGVDPDAIAAAALRQGVPVYVVGCGAAIRPPAAGLGQVTHPDVVRANAEFKVSAGVYSHDLQGTAQMSLAADGKAAERRGVALPAAAATEFGVRESVPGVHQYTLELAPAEVGAWATTRRSFAVRVLPEKPALLIIAGAPSPDYAALRRLLAGRQDTKVTFALRKSRPRGYWLDSAEPKPLASLDAPLQEQGLAGVLLLDAPPEAFTGDQLSFLRRFVESGGGVGVAGSGITALAASVLGDVLPLAGGRGYAEAPCRPALAGSEAPLARELRAAGSWPEAPFLVGHEDGCRPRPGAAVIMEARSVAADLGPLLVVQASGRGRTLAFTGVGSYRWEFSADATDNSRRLYQALWGGIADWLTTPRNDAPVAALCDRETYEPGGSVRVIVHVTDAAFKPVSGAQVSVYLDAATEAAVSAGETAEPGRYEALLDAPAGGPHKLRVAATQGGKKIGETLAHFAVQETSREMQDNGQDSALLHRLADLTGGEYVAAADTAGLAAMATKIAQTRPREADEETVSARHFGRGSGALAALLLLCTVDWVLRRRWGVA